MRDEMRPDEQFPLVEKFSHGTENDEGARDRIVVQSKSPTESLVEFLEGPGLKRDREICSVSLGEFAETLRAGPVLRFDDSAMRMNGTEYPRLFEQHD